MARTIKLAIKEALEELTTTDLDTFCFQLRDRREEPRIRRRAVDDKSLLEITDLLVSTFTEQGALKVTLGILRQINCNQQAETLDSKTKACMDKGDPTFRRISDRELEIKPSQEALNHVASQLLLQAAQGGGASVTAKKPEEVEAEAKAQILSEGGDLSNERLILSRCKIQFGKYKGQTFKWLLENDVSYTAYIVASHQEQRDHTMCSPLLTANKDSLTRYASAYPEILKKVTFHRAKMSLQLGQEGKTLVGFGIYNTETLQGLYKSKDKRKISYVNFLRNMTSTCEPGSRMEAVIRYILQCDQQQAAAPQATRRKRSARRQPNSVSRPTQRKQTRGRWRRTSFSSLPHSVHRHDHL